MKHLYALAAMLLLGAAPAAAEINPDYAAPTHVEAIYLDGKAHIYFLAPADGGVVYASAFSAENGLDGFTAVEQGSDAWYNTGAGGSELSTTAPGMAGHAKSLVSPTFSLDAATAYTASYSACGSRTTNNQKLTVSLWQGEDLVATLCSEEELAPSLNWQRTAAPFQVETAGEGYYLRFDFANNGKACGANLKDVVVESPIPEGRGDLIGYALWCNDACVATYTLDAVAEDRMYLTVTDPTDLELDTTYSYALQALYEGGESPLSALSVIQTPNGIRHIEAAAAPAKAYDLSGRPATDASPLLIQHGRKAIR